MKNSPIKWMGGKKKLIPFIIENMPKKFNNYLEPFFGSGIVMFSIEPEKCICSDYLKEPIVVMNAIKNSSDAFLRKFVLLADGLWEGGGDFYYDTRKYYNANKDSMNDDERAAHFIFLIRSCFNGVIRFNPQKNYSWNVPYGQRGYKKVASQWLKEGKDITPTKIYNDSFTKEIEEYSKFLNIGKKEFHACDFQETISKTKEGDFVYCDPPYLFTEQPYSKEWNEETEKKLYNALVEIDNRGAFFMLSNVYEHKGKENQNLIDRYRNFNLKLKSHTYIVSKRQKVVEALITNY